MEKGTFISEIFWTTDHKFAFQKVGAYYNLYDETSEWHFKKEFRSLDAMQKFMNELRDGNAKEAERPV